MEKEINKNFKGLVKRGEYEKAVRVATTFNPEQPEYSARRYCIERLAEANIISETFDPVKLSIVRAEKDTLDGPLKRVYVIENKAPWLGGK